LLLGYDPDAIPRIPRKQELNVEAVLNKSLTKFMSSGDEEGATPALIFDSVYDSYRGLSTIFEFFRERSVRDAYAHDENQ
jgi:translation elongation factor EF-4